MKKHLKSLFICLGVIVILAAGILFMMNYDPDKPAEPEPNDDNIQTVYSNEDADKIVIKSSDDTLTLEKNGDTWNVDGINSDDIDTMQLDVLVSDALKYETSTVVTDTESADYGFDTPSLVIEITSDGSTDTVTVGNKSAVENSYFATVNGIVFTMHETQYKNLVTGRDDLTSFRRLEIMPDDISEIVIERQDEKIRLYIPKIERMEGTVWHMSEPYDVMASDDFIDSSILEQIGSISLYDIADDFGTERAKLTVTEGDTVYEFRISEPVDGRVNVEFNGKVYDEPASLFEFIDAPIYSYMSKLVSYQHILDIDEVKLEYDGITHTIRRTDSEGNSFEADGAEADTDLTKKIYQAIIGMIATSMYNGEEQGETLMKITYSGSVNEVIEFKAINEYSAAVIKNGISLFTVGIADIDHIKNSVNEYFEIINEE